MALRPNWRTQSISLRLLQVAVLCVPVWNWRPKRQQQTHRTNLCKVAVDSLQVGAVKRLANKLLPNLWEESRMKHDPKRRNSKRRLTKEDATSNDTNRSKR